MELIREAGFPALLSLALFTVGLVHVVRSRSRQTGVAWAVAIVGMGMFGTGIGQRLVHGAIGKIPDVSERVNILSAGTAETTANLILSGAMALVLVALAASVERFADDAPRR